MPLGAALPAIIGGGVALIGGSQQARAAKKQGQAVQNASDQSSATQRYIFDQIRSDTATQRGAGDAATRQIASLMNLNLGPQPGQQPSGQQPQTFPSQGNALASYNGGKNGMGPMLSRGMEPTRSDMIGEDGGIRYEAPGGLSGAGQTQGPGNALSPGQLGQAVPVSNTSQTDWLRDLPGYQFNFDEGMRGLNHGLATGGRLFSGDAGREAIRYGQNYGDRIYNQERNALFSLAGMGQVSQGQSNAAGQNYANNQTAINANNANALGSSYQNSANAWTNALGGVGGAALWGLGKLRK